MDIDQPDTVDMGLQDLRSGRARYTPRQRQELARLAAAQAWLQGADVPEEVRQRELPRFAERAGRIQPTPVLADEMPLEPQEMIRRNVYRDTTGEFGRPGTTWIIDPKTGKPDASRNAPNNDVGYIDAGYDQEEAPPMEAPSDVPATVQGAVDQQYLAQQLSLPGYPPYEEGASGGQMELRGVNMTPRGPVYAYRPRKTDERSQKMEQQQQQFEARQAQSREQHETRARDAKHKAILSRRDRLLKEQQAAIDTHDGDGPAPTLDPQKALRDAIGDYEALDRAEAEQAARAKRDDYLRRKYAGMADKDIESLGTTVSEFVDIGGAERKEELARRKRGASVVATHDEEPLPVAMYERLAGYSPAELLRLQHHAVNQRAYTSEELTRAIPGMDHDQYTQLRRWAAAGAKLPAEVVQMREARKAKGAPSPRTKAEFDALASGTAYRAPDGTLRRKP